MFAAHKPHLEPDTATISRCGKYRYTLTRTWGTGKRVLYCMINPSTATALKPDPTITRCVNLAKQFHSGIYGSLEVVNLFAYRTAYPVELRDFADKGGDAVGPDNDRHTREAIVRADLIILAYGAKDWALERSQVFITLAYGTKPIHHLGLTKNGHPRHPLMLKTNVQPVVW